MIGVDDRVRANLKVVWDLSANVYRTRFSVPWAIFIAIIRQFRDRAPEPANCADPEALVVAIDRHS